MEPRIYVVIHSLAIILGNGEFLSCYSKCLRLSAFPAFLRAMHTRFSARSSLLSKVNPSVITRAARIETHSRVRALAMTHPPEAGKC